MKKWMCVVFVLLTLLALPAVAEVSATPNQELALRTGPNTSNVWISHMPQSTPLTAYEYEMGNGVVWVLVEYEVDGQLMRGYTGLKRMTVNGDIPWADHLNLNVAIADAGTVYAAPSRWGAYRARLNRGDEVVLLEYENDYAFIKFYDEGYGAWSRGYIPTAMLGFGAYDGDARTPIPGINAEANQPLALRTGPSTSYSEYGTMPKATQIVAYEFDQGNSVTWVLVEFMDNGKRVRGYTGLKRLTLSGNIPWADHRYETVYVSYGCEIYAAPSADAQYRSRLNGGAGVTLLEYDGDYAFIEYVNRDSGLPERGYIDAAVLLDGEDWYWSQFSDDYGE